MGTAQHYRISGHESFPCRYTWLPKAVRGLRESPDLFADGDDGAMVTLGIGKNMVRSVRFWAQVSGVVSSSRSGHTVSDFGHAVLGERGFDPFLEDIRTLWLIHWNLSTDPANPLLAWDYLLNRWQDPDIVPSVALKVLQTVATRQDTELSPVTIEQHFDTFLHTYVPTRGRKGEVQEDNLDCPLVELELIVRVGERLVDTGSGRAEAIYAFRREEKPEITAELFTYCLYDFWQKRHPSNATLQFRDVAHGHGSPGQIFKLPEEDVRARVERLARQTDGLFTYAESANIQQVRRNGEANQVELLRQIYEAEVANG